MSPAPRICVLGHAVDVLASGQVWIDPAARQRLVAQLLREADPTVGEHAWSHFAAGAGA